MYVCLMRNHFWFVAAPISDHIGAGICKILLKIANRKDPWPFANVISPNLMLAHLNFKFLASLCN